jgi:DNA polymerase/3'-5' exonuclease PolX
MFTDFKFLLIPHGTELANKRKKIIEDIILKNKGVILKTSQSNFLIIKVDINNLPDYTITSGNIKFSHIQGFFKHNLTIPDDTHVNKIAEIIIERLYLPELISQSLRLSKKLTKEEEERYKISSSHVKTYIKNKKTLNNIENEEFFSNKKNKLQIKQIDPTNENNQQINLKLVGSLGLNGLSNSRRMNEIIYTQVIKDNIEPCKKVNEIIIIPDSNLETKKKNTHDNISNESIYRLSPKNRNKKIFKEIQSEVRKLKHQDEQLGSITYFSDEGISQLNENDDYSNIQTQNNIVCNSYSSDYISSQLFDFPFKNESISSTLPFTSIEKNNRMIRKVNPSNFAFSQGSDKTNINEHITDELEKILDFHSNENNVFESLAYRKAISQIKNAKEKISSCDQLKKYKYLGKSIGNKIKEILLTGKLKKTEYLNNDEKNKTIKLLTSIWGVGMSQANNLYRKGIRSISDLRNNEHYLQPNQILGLKYFEDLQLRIPRNEIEDILNEIQKSLFEILPENVVHIELAGSYRRGKETCGDIDILITRNDDDNIFGVVKSLVESLMRKRLIQEILSINESFSRSQFMGIIKYQNFPNRRIDIKMYKKENFAFALLYFTGSAYFNRSMRLFARKIGYHLSDFHLVSDLDKKIIIFKTEREIFEFLGVDYKEPSEREI